ncbi:class I SAM-dependent methyltransferase [Streptomyces sp. ITFR-16]|uniref:SAM-dependent methyltransferase n=1 Tax=Streptomyces sp. ITFR-16 TaxID=3075198 RepID=UPI00288B724D|nr:class I SAM-dependent methyltransferase [Streptomyces sp. ITFR-16]WNI26425.1 class I SAM-dependent methyltransferase [Streptomyces sp. ITFR-16]
MDREKISGIAHALHPVKSPFDDDSVRRLLEHGVPRADARILDLGCGTGEWLLRALDTHPRLRAEGVDVSGSALRQAADAADRRGVRERLVLHHQEAERFGSPHRFDLVLNVGASHAFGGLLATLAAARAHLAPGGRVLIGESYWEAEPTPEAVEMLGEFTDLATTLDRVTADGWTPVHGHISTRAERDAYEWACWGSLASWALDHPEDPDSAKALETAALRRSEWLRVYRDSWGFVGLVLRRTTG